MLDIISASPQNDRQGAPLSDDEISALRASSPRLARDDYAALLAYLHHTGHPYHAFYDFPHSENSLVLQANAKCVTEIDIGGLKYSCEVAHEAQSLVLFQHPRVPEAQDIGRIQTIWGIPLDGCLRYFLVVRPHKALSQAEQECGPYLAYPGFECRLVDAELMPDSIIIEPHHLITHVFGLLLEKGSYEIPRATLACNTSFRRRRQQAQ
ncbi:hypothetical protein EV122DRAFT_227111 [Schizophyllum commune]